MSRSKLLVASWVVFASLVLVLGLIGWLQGVSPFRVAQAAGLIDDSFADFTAVGASGCYVRASGSGVEGEVVMSLETDFPGSALPAGWYESLPAVATVSGGILSVNEGTAGTGGLFAPNQTLEFTATFVAASGQLAGLGVGNYSDAPFAIFNSNGTDLLVRTDAEVGLPAETVNNLGNTYFGSPHRYRIEWGATNVVYYIDGGAVATHLVTPAANLAILFQDFNVGGTTLDIEWVRLWPLTSPCVFVSRAIDSTYAGFTFTGISTTLSTPAGTSIGFEARTSADGSGWGSWVAVNGDGTFNAGVNQWMQYRATLSSSNVQVTPAVLSVQAHGLTPSAVRLTSFEAARSDSAFGGWLGVLGGGVLILGITRVILRRKDQN